MEIKQIQELVKLVNRTNISELNIRQGEFEVSIKNNSGNVAMAPMQMVPQMPQVQQQVAPAPAPAAAPVAAPAQADAAASGPEENPNHIVVKSPMVGTFYRRPSPDKEVYCKPGDTINTGDVICIIEAMKLFNEIEAEITGKLVKVLVEEASPVEYDQPLFIIDPTA